MLQGQAGWTCRAVRNKVQQITWDTTAAQRESRHANAVLPSEMENYMHSVATLVSRGGRHGDVLDVGCGTGLIFSFLEKVCGDGGKGRGKGKGKAKGKDNNVDGGVDAGLGGFEQGRLVGIDLSAEMLNIAQASFPSAQFVQGDYLDYDCDTGRFDSIVFNECLHYFEDQQEAIEKAVRLCKPAGAHGVSKIVISHPRGMKNVRLLNQHNQLMVPSLLPTVDELQQIIDTLSSQLGTSLRLATAPHCDSTHYLAVIELA
ncbi:S-adenosyl-L-methionine-dependent methyltransferase [Ochromonadaceae sp. CCMP2298]|nr:S-adenosyl-L-methionine-dependent methyltransferase [Ochromonadaceae sp. CCMP2298]